MEKSLYRVLFAVALIAILLVKEVYILGIIVLFECIVLYKNCMKIGKKVIKSILFFNLGVSLGYILLGFVKGFNPLYFIIYINLKVYAITYFVFWFFIRVNIVDFFSFSRDLSYLLTIALSQIISYKKTYEEFRLNFKARVIKRIRERQKGFVVKVFEFFLTKALRDANERGLAMKARGFF